MHIIIKPTHFSWKPILSISNLRKDHSILSYALLMSKLKAKKPAFPYWCFI